ncbi:MICOS complex subunit MIC60 [Klebsiella variicola]|uniref:MICOS complex subunit MIC60 n=1 Tax=Klebsiella variicola TaxID=244366 RepID=UPI001D198014|nr:MICOS complex subunit MIC60 [Klebsiella variicola]
MLELSVSKINNVVTFTVDKNSIAQAKKAADDLHKYFQKIQDPKIRFQQQKQRRQKARQIADDARFNDKPRNAAEMKAQRAAEKQKARDEKARLREQAQLQRRQETAELKLRHAGLQLGGIKGKYGMDPKQQYEALRYIRQQTAAFAQGQITSARMNALIRERITLERRAAAAAQKAAQAQKTNYVGAAKKFKDPNSKEYGIARLQSAATGFGSIFAAGNLAARIKQTGDENLELIRMSERVKTNPNAIKTMVAWGQQHGVDSANIDKATDNMKDVRERLAMTVNDAQMKNGEWKGGDGGITTIMNKFGWSKEQIGKFQDNPLDFIQATVNEGQRRGMSQAQIGTLIESLGDDLMHYTDMFMNNGAEFIKTLRQLKESGQTLNDEQIRQIMEYGTLTTKMAALTNGLDINLFTGFMDGFGKSGDQLTENTKNLNESAHLLGEGLGNLATQVTGATVQISQSVEAINDYLKSKFPEWFSGDNNQPAAQQLYNGVTGSANATADWIQDKTGFNTRSVGPAVMDWLGMGPSSTGTAANNYSLSGQSLRDSAQALPSTPALSYQVTPTFNLTFAPEVPLTIQSDVSRLSDYIDFNARASAASFERSLTLQINSGQSTTGG